MGRDLRDALRDYVRAMSKMVHLLSVLVLALSACDCPVPVGTPSARKKPVPPELKLPTELAEELMRPGPGAPRWAQNLEGHFPQPRWTWRLFEDASAPLRGDRLEPAFLLLQVKVTARLDTIQPDLKLVLEHPGTPRIAYDERDNRDTAHFLLRIPSLAKGERIALRVYDRDLKHLEYGGSAELLYAGELPLRVVTKQMIVELRGLAQEQVDALFAKRLRAFDVALARAGTPEPRPLAVDLGLGRSPIPELRSLAHEAAAIGGWGEPRLAAKLAKLAKLEASFEAALKKAVAESLAQLPARGAIVEAAGSLEVRVAAFEPKTSRVNLEIKNRGAEPVECSVRVSWIGKLTRFNLVDVQGATFPLKLARCTLPGATTAPETGSLAIPPAAKATAVLELDPRHAEGRTPATPALLRVGDSAHDDDARLLRLN